MREHNEQIPLTQDVVEINGKKYQRKDSGYTLRTYYSHGGPGWDYRWPLLEKHGVDNPDKLPNTPYYILEEVIN